MRVPNPDKYKIPLNAIAQSRQYALLLMDLWSNHERSPKQFQPYQGHKHDRGFYAQAADLEVPQGALSRLTTAMGVKDPDYLTRLRALLRLPDEVWVLADDHNWPESQIRRLTEMSVEDAINRARYWAGLPATNFVESKTFEVVKHDVEKISQQIEKMTPAEQLRMAQILQKLVHKVERDTF